MVEGPPMNFCLGPQQSLELPLDISLAITSSLPQVSHTEGHAEQEMTPKFTLNALEVCSPLTLWVC